MNLLSAARLSRLWTILIPMTILVGCGDGDGPTRIVNEPAAPYDGPPDSCFEALDFEDICGFSYNFQEFFGGPAGIVPVAEEPLIAGDAGNTSDKVVKAVKLRNAGPETFGGFVLTVRSTPPAPFDIPAGSSFTIKIWAQRPVPVLFEPHRDDGSGGNVYQGENAEVQHGGTGWEELTFDLPPGSSYNATGFVFIFDQTNNGNFENDPNSWTFYIDDITPVEGEEPEPATFPITFDDDPAPAVTEFGGAGYAFEPGPVGGGDGNALRITRDGGDDFAGAWLAVPEIPNDAGPQTISAEVYSPTAGIRIVAKAEYGDNMGSGEVEANEVVVAGWQTLTWTFTNLAAPNVYNRFTILPNLGTVDDPAQSYYFDDIDLVGAGGGADPGTIPDVVLYATDPNETVDLVFGTDYTEISPFGSGSVFDNNDTSDADFSPAFSVTTGDGYGAQVGQLAFVGFGGGFAAGYGTVDFKAKGLNNDLIRVKFLDAGDYLDITLTSSSYSTDLGNGWYQVSVPLSDFTGVGTATGLLFETDNTAASSFTFLLTDIGFSGTAGGVGFVPDVVIYATDPNETVDLVFGTDYTGFDSFGSGAAFDNNVTTDADYNPAFGVTTGNGYGAQVGQFAIVGFAAGFASGYQTLDFKAKGLNNDLIRVKFLDDPNYLDITLTSSSYSTDLGNGWYQVSVPLADFTGVATATGLLFETDNTAASAFTFLLTDFGFSGTVGGPATSPDSIIPEIVLFATDPNETVDLVSGTDYTGLEAFGSGSVFDEFFATDPDFNPAFAVTSGAGYGANVGQLAYVGFAAGFASGYTTLDFKVKGMPDDLIRVKFLDNGDYLDVTLTDPTYSTLLGNGWYQVSIPLSAFTGVDTATGLLFESNNASPSQFTFLLTDIGFSGTAGGVGFVPDVVIYATDPNETVDLVFGTDYTGFDSFGSGAAFDNNVTTDADYNPAFGVTTGNGYGAQVGQFAIVGFAAGFASGYQTLDFKAKGLNNDLIRVKFLDDPNYLDITLTSSSYSTDLGNGWYQVSVPLTDFTGVATATGLLFETDNTAASAFTFLLTDFGFSGTAGGGAGIVPDVVIYATDPNETVDLVFGTDYTGFDSFGSGAAFDNNVTTDADYNPAFGVTTGNGYGAQVGQFAIVGFAAGFASGYQTLDFKAKGLNNDLIRVKFLDDPNYLDITLTSSSYSTDLGNGWYQVSVPLADFTGVATATGLLFETDNTAASAFTFLLTDFGFSGTAGGGGAVVNGDFEAGDLSGFEVFPANGGTVAADNTENNTPGGSWSAHVVSNGAFASLVIKQSFLYAGTVTNGDTVDVSFDMKGTALDGGVINPKLIAEGAGGAATGFELDTIAAPTPGWTTYTYSPVVNADVTLGISFEIAVVCGGAASCSADVFIDNVSITLQ